MEPWATSCRRSSQQAVVPIPRLLEYPDYGPVSYIGTELIGVTVGETQNPRKNVSKTIRRRFFRIVLFYIGGTFVISLTVPNTNDVSNTPLIALTCPEALLVANAAAAASPFVAGQYAVSFPPRIVI
jgi:amino acid permease